MYIAGRFGKEAARSCTHLDKSLELAVWTTVVMRH
jgi:hypothetical protein